ncbi:MAG TPA: M14 family metallopeptidase [Thermoanaerobaculia bacterium]|nr:M14 family metallopeptidase [Thermoanaerobaculia bacterium]
MRRAFPLRLTLAALAAFAASAPIAARAESPLDPAWTTPAEASGFARTPTYDETLAFLRKLETKLPEMKVTSFGTSAGGRALPLVILSKERRFAPPAAGERPGQPSKPIVMIQSGIHAGEIDGKDATLMILRDLALGRHRELLDAATILFLPIYNADGHERISPYNRPNQDGPREGMGFRTTTDGLDLNRDHVKLASPEARALVALVNAWRPQLHVDVHVTDGVDMPWVLTWSAVEAPQLPAPVDAWVKAHLPKALAATDAAGFPTGPYVDLVDRTDLTKGFSSWVGGARYSTGYFALRNRPSILIETHSYKPYRDRVLATQAFLLGLLAEVGKDPKGLIEAVTAAEARVVELGRPGAPPSEMVVGWSESDRSDPFRWPVYAAKLETSAVTAKPVLLFDRTETTDREVPWIHGSKATATVARPRGYLVLPGWPQIEERLTAQGLRFTRVAAPFEAEVEIARLSQPEYASAPYQGLTAVTKVHVERSRESRTIPAGSLWVPADQPDLAVAAELLEPEAPDSLVSWGLLSTIFEQKEYIDPKVLEPWVRHQLEDSKVAAEWQEALKDEKLASDPQARYAWWYRRTPYFDQAIGLLPVYRVMEAPKP